MVDSDTICWIVFLVMVSTAGWIKEARPVLNWAMQIWTISACTSFICCCRSESWVCITSIVLTVRVCWTSTLWMFSTTSDVNQEFSWLTKSALKQGNLETYEEWPRSPCLNSRDCAMRRLVFVDSKEALNFAILSFRSASFAAAHVLRLTLKLPILSPSKNPPEAPLSSSQTDEEPPLHQIHELVIYCMRLQPIR